MLRTLPRLSRTNPLKAAAAVATQPTPSVGDISSLFPSLNGKEPKPLPACFADIKRHIISGNERAVEASWARLLDSISRRLSEINQRGSSTIPSVEYSTLSSLTSSDKTEIRSRGAVVIRNVLARDTAHSFLSNTKRYISLNQPKVRAFPANSPSVYELYWTPSQLAARSDHNLLDTQRFLQSLWHASNPDTKISTTHTLTYADRLRIRPPGDAQFALGAHIDGGSVERWEDPEYRSVYSQIFNGNWEEYDPYDATHRVNANMNLYMSPGGCAMFRMFQGWLSLSSTGPGQGSLKVNPMLRETTAYMLLRPFFDLKTNKLLAPSKMTPDLQGAVLAASQELNDTWHPHLNLARSMVSIPKVEPGDYVAWHCDTIHAVDPQHTGMNESSVFYIPATPVCGLNVRYLEKQRDAALVGQVPPDFPGAGIVGEGDFKGRMGWDGITEEGKRAMGMGPKGFEVTKGMSEGERSAIEEANSVLFN